MKETEIEIKNSFYKTFLQLRKRRLCKVTKDREILSIIW